MDRKELPRELPCSCAGTVAFDLSELIEPGDVSSDLESVCAATETLVGWVLPFFPTNAPKALQRFCAPVRSPSDAMGEAVFVADDSGKKDVRYQFCVHGDGGLLTPLMECGLIAVAQDRASIAIGHPRQIGEPEKGSVVGYRTSFSKGVPHTVHLCPL